MFEISKMINMLTGFEPWLVMGVVVAIFLMMAFTRLAPDLILLGGLTFLMFCNLVDQQKALLGFANRGMLTVGVLFVVAAGLKETGCMSLLLQSLLGRVTSLRVAQTRVILPTVFMSAFLNNTPVVAMVMPIICEWAKKNRQSPSKLLIPLSYASILGGVCTLIGTSTNLVVNGLLMKTPGYEGLSMFTIAWVGVPCALVGVFFLLCVGKYLLPDQQPVLDLHQDPREYVLEMQVPDQSRLIGMTIEKAGLRHLQGVYLMEIDRGEEIIAAVSPQEKLCAGDRLVFVGVVDSVRDLQKMAGLEPATDQVFKLDSSRSHRCLIEAVVSDVCPLVGLSIRAGRFRTVYNAAVIAVARSGQRLRQKIGDIVLQPGDTLLLEALPAFVKQHHNSRDFFLVSQLDDSAPPRHHRMWWALAILVGMVLVVSVGITDMLLGALAASGLMLVTGCLSTQVARRSIDWQVLIAIASAFGIGEAMASSGAAEMIAHTFIGWAGGSPWWTLVMVYLITNVFTELITNNAAAVLVFPIALAASAGLGDTGVNFMPFVITIMIASSASFSTPIGYQTNLMVYGPGGYRFADYLKIGIPMNLLVGAVTVLLTPILWSF